MEAKKKIKMPKKKNPFLIISISLFIVSLLSLTVIYSTQETALFPEKTSTSGIAPDKTTYIEGDNLGIKQTIDRSGNCGEPSIKASAIWIDGKKYGCSETYQFYDNGNAIRNVFVCNNKVVSSWLGKTFTLNTNWGFDYGNQELDKELTAGSHTVEGWALTNEPQSTFCPEGGANYIDFFRFEINVKPLPCVLDQNQMLVVESFSDDFSKNDLRYNAIKFCNIHPPIIVDKFTRTSYNDLTVYEKLRNNQIVPVDENKVVSVFYVIDKDIEDVPVVCDIDKAYNIEEERCEDVIGFIQVCSSGYFEPSTGLCTIQPESEFLCEKGRYDSALGKCIIQSDIECERGDYNEELDACIYEPSFSVTCKKGNYDEDNDVCIYVPEVVNKCDYEFVYNEETGYCERSPDRKVVCPEGSFDSEKNACVIKPDIGYLCLNGKLVDVTDEETGEKEKACVIKPEEKIVCRSGFSYNKEIDKCVRIPEEQGFNKLFFIPIGTGLTGLSSLGLWFWRRK